MIWTITKWYILPSKYKFMNFFILEFEFSIPGSETLILGIGILKKLIYRDFAPKKSFQEPTNNKSTTVHCKKSFQGGFSLCSDRSRSSQPEPHLERQPELSRRARWRAHGPRPRGHALGPHPAQRARLPRRVLRGPAEGLPRRPRRLVSTRGSPSDTLGQIPAHLTAGVDCGVESQGWLRESEERVGRRRFHRGVREFAASGSRVGVQEGIITVRAAGGWGVPVGEGLFKVIIVKFLFIIVYSSSIN